MTRSKRVSMRSQKDYDRRPTTPNEQSIQEPDSLSDIEASFNNPIQPPLKKPRTVEDDNTHKEQREWTTPQKAGVKFCIEFLEHKNIPFFKQDVFDFASMPRRSGYRALAGESTRRVDSRDLTARQQPRVIPPEKIREMEILLEEEGIEGRALTWEQLGTEVGLDVDRKTVQDAMGTMEYHKCVACKKGWVNSRIAERRVEHSRVMLERYPHWYDWIHIRFSDEVHWGFGPHGTLMIIRKKGMRRCQSCVQQERQPKEKDEKKVHAWSAVGWDFKADITFYDSGNSNGKMTQRCYIDQILEPIVKPWLDAGQVFTLEEDGDSGHGTSQSNIVRTWKRAHGLQSYFNCAASPDLSPIENCWQAPKQNLNHHSHWDEVTTRQLVVEAWNDLSQSFINEQIKSIPDRYKAVIDGDGQMTAY
ncbi:hmg box protein [Rutstroemia sp. NJR-2017a WRK4]|nr:hmg box protein [Rutstroemia sp. NJR-2017a WRK4]